MADPEQLSDDDLFDGAVNDAPAEAAAEPASEAAEQTQPRDEAGRFAGKPEDQPETEAATDQPAKTPVDDNAAMVPSWRVREINEEKRALADRIAAYEAERQQWQRQQQQPEAKPAQQPAKPDPLLDPDGYAEWIENRAQQRYQNERSEDSLQRARKANPQEFDEAYAAATRAIDPALKVRMQNSRDPGETLLEWHRENKTRQEIGGDLNAYKQRVIEESLKDPAILARAVELARGNAQPQQPNGRPRVELPPSLNGASRSNAALRSAMTADIDDDALWNEATA